MFVADVYNAGGRILALGGLEAAGGLRQGESGS
jgi:hypothetical protein